jgi:beta-fructofuranosidase
MNVSSVLQTTYRHILIHS